MAHVQTFDAGAKTSEFLIAEWTNSNQIHNLTEASGPKFWKRGTWKMNDEEEGDDINSHIDGDDDKMMTIIQQPAEPGRRVQ